MTLFSVASVLPTPRSHADLLSFRKSHSRKEEPPSETIPRPILLWSLEYPYQRSHYARRQYKPFRAGVGDASAPRAGVGRINRPACPKCSPELKVEILVQHHRIASGEDCSIDVALLGRAGDDAARIYCPEPEPVDSLGLPKVCPLVRATSRFTIPMNCPSSGNHKYL